MINLERLKNVFGFRHSISRNLYETFASVTHLVFGKDNDTGDERCRLAFQSLVHPLLFHDGSPCDSGKEIYRKLLAEYFDQQSADSRVAEICDIDPLPPQEAVSVLCNADRTKSIKIAEFLIVLTISLDSWQSYASYIRSTALALGMTERQFNEFFRQISDAEKRKQRLRNSSRGIIAALVLILLFCLTAKYLQSLIFGLLLACILLPLEVFYERRLRKKSGVVYCITAFFSMLFCPLRKLSELLKRSGDQSSAERNSLRRDAAAEKRPIRQAVILTVLTAVLISYGAGWCISQLTGHYMLGVQQSIREWEHERLISGGKEVSRSGYALEKLRHNLADYPMLQHALDKLTEAANNPEMRKNAVTYLLRRSGGIIDTAGAVAGSIVSVLCDILLTIFFALLFLLKFAEFRALNPDHKSGSEYMVRSIFNGIWLPAADDKMITETCRIIDGILFRLRRWLKGYLTLILIDSSVYTTCFFLMGVPFYLPLGLVAGCGIALPYLGPIISCCLTLFVTLLSGGAPPEMFLAITISYLIYNGIIEQFILYPAVIGDSLGLNTLETIVVVLLGAIVAGIPGMIFALPTASVAKYIIPMIYHGFSSRSKLENIPENNL